MCIAEGLDAVIISADEVLIQFGTRSHPSELLRDGDLSGSMAAIFGCLRERPCTLKELLAEVPTADRVGAVSLIEDLAARGILSEARFSAVAQYLRYGLDGERPESTRRLSFIGVGPLGARVASNVSRHNTASLLLLDDRPTDAIWESFMPLGAAQAPRGSRADRAASSILPRVECLDHGLDPAGIEAAVAEADLIVLALEQVDIQTAHLVNRFAVRAQKPWLHLVIDGNFGVIGPLFLPPDTACYNDYRTLGVAATPSPLMARKHRDYVLRRGAGSFFAGLPSYADIVAGYGSVAVTHFLLRNTCFALGRVMTIDFERMEIDVEDVIKLPRCPVCGVDRPTYRAALPPT